MRRILAAASALAMMAAAAHAAPPRKQAAPAPAPVASATPVQTPEEAVARANAVLNATDSLTAGFTQTGQDGKAVTGRLFVRRKSGMRFDYDPPATMEIVADASTVIVRDRKLNTSDRYPVSQTPLAFLLRDSVDLGRDFRLTAAGPSQGGAFVSFTATSTFVGDSKVTLYFDEGVTTLRGWHVVDAQNRHTVLTLSNVDTSPIADARTFDVRFQRAQ